MLGGKSGAERRKVFSEIKSEKEKRNTKRKREISRMRAPTVVGVVDVERRTPPKGPSGGLLDGRLRYIRET